MTSSVYDDGLSLFTPMVHDPNNLATPSMNQLTLNRCSSEFGTSAADAAVSKERASKARHEQRRSNLRRKRLKEQMMQVCEGFVREQIAIVTVQAFVEANFLNDMMNFQHEVINSAVEMELRRVIRGVLEEIYFAHIATLFLENMMAEELREVALGQVALMKKKRLLDETGVI